MALKFLNKKGWHTGSLRNIENVWKAEQKRDAETRKLEELKKQIRDEHEKQEVRQLQVQAGLVSGSERLEFLYSGLGAGKSNSEEEHLLGKPVEETKEENIIQQVAAAPGSLFVEEKISANDSWRKIRSDPLLSIRQQELAARKRVLSNPVQMERLRKEAEEKVKEQRLKAEKKQKRKERKELKKKRKVSDGGSSEDNSPPPKRAKQTGENEASNSKLHKEEDDRRGDRDNMGRDKDIRRDRDDRIRYEEGDRRGNRDNVGRSDKRDDRRVRDEDRRRDTDDRGRDEDRRRDRNDGETRRSDREVVIRDETRRRDREDRIRHEGPRDREDGYENRRRENGEGRRLEDDKSRDEGRRDTGGRDKFEGSRSAGKPPLPKKRQLSDEEKAALLREMQMDAERHEEDRWKRVKKAEMADAIQEKKDAIRTSNNFLEQTNRSVYGTGNSDGSIADTLHRKSHYRDKFTDANAFKR